MFSSFTLFSSPRNTIDKSDNPLFYTISAFEQLIKLINDLRIKEDNMACEPPDKGHTETLDPDLLAKQKKYDSEKYAKYILLAELDNEIMQKIKLFNRDDIISQIDFCKQLKWDVMNFLERNREILIHPRSQVKNLGVITLYLASTIGIGYAAAAASFSTLTIFLAAWLGGNASTNLFMDLLGGDAVLLPESLRLIVAILEELQKLETLLETQVKEKNLYHILGLDPDATTEQITAAYRRKALIFHPDKNVGASEEKLIEQKAQFLDIANAYNVLTDPHKRNLYDLQHKEYLSSCKM